MKFKKSLVLAAAVAAAVAVPAAFATNGYLPHGASTDAKAMGGVGIAVPMGGMAAASNPAAQMYVGNKLTFGMDWFRPYRSATGFRTAGTPNDGIYRDSGSNDFFVPEFGYATPVGSSSSLGVVVYGAGLGTDYGLAEPTLGSSPLYMLLKQMTIAPTWATKVGNHSFGVSLNLVKQTLDVRGLENFDSTTYSQASGNVTNKGEDAATGIGVRVGWLGELTPNLSMGAFYQPQTSMSKFGKYRGMLAEQGKADVPAQYGLGLSFKAAPATVVGFDVVQVKWKDVKSFGNEITSDGSWVTQGRLLGSSNGVGFGWKDQTVYKLGVSHQIGKWNLRAGYNNGKSPVQATQTLFNTLAPAVTETHYTLGAGFALTNTTDISLTYMYSPNKELKGSGSSSGYANPDLKMNQYSFGIGLNVKM